MNRIGAFDSALPALGLFDRDTVPLSLLDPINGQVSPTNTRWLHGASGQYVQTGQAGRLEHLLLQFTNPDAAAVTLTDVELDG